MRGLDRYIGRTVVVSTALVLCIIVGLDAVTAFIDEAGDMSDTYDVWEVLLYVALTIPQRQRKNILPGNPKPRSPHHRG